MKKILSLVFIGFFLSFFCLQAGASYTKGTDEDDAIGVGYRLSKDNVALFYELEEPYGHYAYKIDMLIRDRQKEVDNYHKFYDIWIFEEKRSDLIKVCKEYEKVMYEPDSKQIFTIDKALGGFVLEEQVTKMEKNIIEEAIGEVLDACNIGWRWVRDQIAGDEKIVAMDMTIVSDRLKAPITIVAYTLMFIFWMVNITKKALYFELYTIRGGTEVFAGLILGKLWVDVSVTFLTYIVKWNDSLVQTILSVSSQSSMDFTNFQSMIPIVGNSDLFIIGWIVDFIMALVKLLPILLVTVIMYICGCIIMVKLVIRSIEIASMLIVAPIFFATIIGESTRQYFRTYMLTFISLVCQTIFMAIVYTVGIEWWTTSFDTSDATETYNWIVRVLPNVIVAIAITTMIVKPPKVLENLIK